MKLLLITGILALAVLAIVCCACVVAAGELTRLEEQEEIRRAEAGRN